jgi:hypothetical protein
MIGNAVLLAVVSFVDLAIDVEDSVAVLSHDGSELPSRAWAPTVRSSTSGRFPT